MEIRFRIPVSTYRLQFSRRFRFEDARALVPYLDALGVTDIYASPIFQARRGSAHGYDVTDPTRINPELGGEEEFDRIVGELKTLDMGLMLDIVPNHMAASSENRWWRDLLERGAGSTYAQFFDIDWHSHKKALEKKILLPVLGRPYGSALENRELTLHMDKNGFALRYGEAKFPLSIRSCLRILSHRIETLEENFGPDSPVFREYWALIEEIENLPESPPADPAAAELARQEEAIRQKISRLYRGRPEIRSFLDENMRSINGRRGERESFDALDRLLSDQHYWLSFWRLANEEINYRRFFAISDLIGLRVEDFDVFKASHELVLRLAAEGKISGLRVDHVDGLYDPLRYLVTLQDRLAASADPGPPPGFYIVVEKILTGGETLPPEWPVCGTTGYDFLNAANGIFVSARGTRELDEIYARFLGEKMDFEETAYRCRKLVMDTHFAGEMHTLGNHMGTMADKDRHGRDLPRKEIRQALIEATACFPVYRTYIRDHEMSARDRRYLGKALREAQQRGSETSAHVFEFLKRVILPENQDSLAGELKEERLRFLMRWQQFTGPIMAKGLEDTAHYVYNRLVSSNEVGGDPSSPEISPLEFHRRMEGALARFPFGMNATSTHDSKRSEDVRARINVLSELPREWEKCLLLWSHWNAEKKKRIGGSTVPDRNEEILIYQTLLGAWPLEKAGVDSFVARAKDYMVKAVREAKVYTRWDKPNPPHESAVCEFVESILEDRGGNRFLEDFLLFQKKVAHYGAINSLAQLLLKIASPGVPDFYQGTELWDFSLVDPDNRRPVEFRSRTGMLKDLMVREREGALPLIRELVSGWGDGRIKLFLTYKALGFRKRHRDLFLSGAYVPMTASGPRKEHVLSFAREHNGFWAIAAVPRLSTRLSAPVEFPLGSGAWGTHGGLILPDRAPLRWTDAITGEEVASTDAGDKRALPLRDIFRHFPVALLYGTAA